MSWRGKKRKEFAVTHSDEEEPNKSSKRDSSDDTDSIFVCEISKNRKVSVRSWQGKPVIDIREFYVKDGKTLPGKKGISLSMDQWDILRKHMKEIDEAVAENS